MIPTGETGLIDAAFALLRRDMSLFWARGAAPGLGVGVYLTLMAMIPLSLGPDSVVLGRIAPGLSYMCLALVSLLSLERLFERDYEDGLFDLLRLGVLPLELIVLIKAGAQWLGAGLILTVLTPLVMMALGAPTSVAGLGLLTSGLGSLAFALIGAIGAGLSLGLRKGGALMAVLVLPLYIPPVIFGAGAMDAARSGGDVCQGLILLLAYALFALAIAPFAAAAAIRSALG